MYRRHVLRVTREGGSFRVTLPAPIMRSIGCTWGDLFSAAAVGRCIVLVPIDNVVERHVMTTASELIEQLMPEASREVVKA